MESCALVALTESDLAAMGLMHEAIEFGQCEHIQIATTSKEIWDKLCQLHIIQQQDTNVHYYLQELYLKKWDKHTSMLDHIGFFLNLKHCITEARLKLDDILVVHAILYFLPCSNIWVLLNKTSLIKRKCLPLISLVLNSYLFMIMLNMIVKPTKMRRNQNLIKCSCWSSQHCF